MIIKLGLKNAYKNTINSFKSEKGIKGEFWTNCVSIAEKYANSVEKMVEREKCSGDKIKIKEIVKNVDLKDEFKKISEEEMRLSKNLLGTYWKYGGCL